MWNTLPYCVFCCSVILLVTIFVADYLILVVCVLFAIVAAVVMCAFNVVCYLPWAPPTWVGVRNIKLNSK